jgi:hypothetical protein
MNATQPTDAARGVLFIENMSSLYSLGYISYSTTPSKRPDGTLVTGDERDWKICKNWSEDSCIKRFKTSVNGYVVLGSCLNSEEIGCVESLAISNSLGKNEELTLVGPATSGVTDIPESQEFGIPRSSSRPLYQDSNGQLYLVRASIYAGFPEIKTYMNLNVDVTPISKIVDSTIDAPEVVSLPNNLTGMGVVTVRPTREDCLAIDKGICYRALKADLSQEYHLKLRVPTGVSGWMNGRLAHPKFTLTRLNSKSQLIDVSAKPVVMPIAGGWATYEELPPNFLTDLYPYSRLHFDKKTTGFFISSPSVADHGFIEYATWAPYLKDKAIASVTNWSFSTQLTSSYTYCSSLAGELSGVISSNASVYSSRPPTWNAADATLSYQVASPHFDENGNENVGTYTLAISINAIKCLYGQKDLPPSATISIGYGNNFVNVATQTIKSEGGWVYFSANGFHYSDPTIRVKFAKPLAPKLDPGQSTTIGPSGEILKIQWCAKGYAKRKVVGANPVCPKGYKKIADPTIR